MLVIIIIIIIMIRTYSRRSLVAHCCQKRAGGDKRPLRLETFDQFSTEEDYNHQDLATIGKTNFQRRKVRLIWIMMVMLVQAVMIKMVMVSVPSQVVSQKRDDLNEKSNT